MASLLAERMGTTQSAITYWERGTKSLRSEVPSPQRDGVRPEHLARRVAFLPVCGVSGA